MRIVHTGVYRLLVFRSQFPLESSSFVYDRREFAVRFPFPPLKIPEKGYEEAECVNSGDEVEYGFMKPGNKRITMTHLITDMACDIMSLR